MQVSVARKVETRPSTHLRTAEGDVFLSAETATYSLSDDFPQDSGLTYDQAKQRLQAEVDRWCDQAKAAYGPTPVFESSKQTPTPVPTPKTDLVGLQSLPWYRFVKGAHEPCGRLDAGWTKVQPDEERLDSVARDLYNRLVAAGARNGIVLPIDGVPFNLRLGGQDGSLFNRVPVKEAKR